MTPIVYGDFEVKQLLEHCFREIKTQLELDITFWLCFFMFCAIYAVCVNDMNCVKIVKNNETLFQKMAKVLSW